MKEEPTILIACVGAEAALVQTIQNFSEYHGQSWVPYAKGKRLSTYLSAAAMSLETRYVIPAMNELGIELLSLSASSVGGPDSEYRPPSNMGMPFFVDMTYVG